MEQRLYIVEDETGDHYSFIGSIGDALIAQGIIFRRGEKWCIQKKDTDIVASKRMDLSVCDFCSARPVTFDIDATEFHDAFGHHSLDGWVACETCGTCVERNDRAGLLRHVLRVADPHPIVRETLREHLQLFWQHYKGIKRIPPKPFGH